MEFPPEGRAATRADAGIYWLASGRNESESTLWFQEQGAIGAAPIAALSFSATELYASGTTVWVAGAEGVAAYDATSGAVRNLEVVADGNFAGFSTEGPVFQRRIPNRQGGVPYRYELWLYAPLGEEPTRFWAAPVGTRPERVWTAEGTTFATGYTFFGNGPSRAVIVQLTGGSARTLVCLPAELRFAASPRVLPVGSRQGIAALVSLGPVDRRSLIFFSLE